MSRVIPFLTLEVNGPLEDSKSQVDRVTNKRKVNEGGVFLPETRVIRTNNSGPVGHRGPRRPCRPLITPKTDTGGGFSPKVGRVPVTPVCTIGL